MTAVSIIMPTYQRITYIREAIESALAQTFRDFELIVSDNGMSSELEQLCASYGDTRIKYRHNGRNIGMHLNYLVPAGEVATGTYIATLHDDDVWEPTFLEKLVAPMEADPSINVAFSDHWIIRKDSAVDLTETDHWSTRSGRRALEQGRHQPAIEMGLVAQSIQVGYAGIYRRAAIDWSDFPDDIDPLYDFWITYQLVRDGGAAWYQAERLTRYRFHPASTTAKTPYLEPTIRIWEHLVEDPRVGSILPALQGELATLRARHGFALLREGRRAEARPWLRGGIRHSSSPRGAVALLASYLPGTPKLAERVQKLVDRRHAAAKAALATSIE